MYCSTHFYINVSKHKSLYLQLISNHNKFYESILSKLVFVRTKHTHTHKHANIIINSTHLKLINPRAELKPNIH